MGGLGTAHWVSGLRFAWSQVVGASTWTMGRQRSYAFNAYPSLGVQNLPRRRVAFSSATNETFTDAADNCQRLLKR